jgi:hypothetical protein
MLHYVRRLDIITDASKYSTWYRIYRHLVSVTITERKAEERRQHLNDDVMVEAGRGGEFVVGGGSGSTTSKREARRK